MIYEAVLRDVGYEPLWPLLAAAVRDGGVAADASLLDEAANLAEDDDIARELRRLALELRTAGIEGGDAVEGVGLVGTCDGAGAFPVFMARRRSDGSFMVVNLLFRTTGELRDGFALPFEDRADVDALGEQMRQGAGTELVEVPIEAAAALCRRRLDAAEASVDFDELPEDIARAVVQARRLPADEAAVVPPEPADAPVSLARTRELLDAPALRYWLLDVAELVEAQIEPPPADGSTPDDAWFDAALARLADTERTAARVASLADHMAQWYALADQQTPAAEFARLAQMTRQEPAQSPLVRTMLEKSLAAAAAADRPEAGRGGDEPVATADDPILRRTMRQRFFEDVDTPTGFDVIHLAMACMSFVLLEALQGMIADRRQPRPDELYALANDVGEIIAMCIVDADDQMPMLIAQRLLAQGLTFDDVAALMGPFLDQLDVYFDFVAPDDLYAAMDAPDVPMPNAFYD